jgi:hypothetical protein
MRSRARRFAALISLLGCALLAACAGGASAPEIALRDDTFRPYREYATPQRTVRAYPNTLATELIARVDRKTAATTTLLSADFTYWGSRMRKYESARDVRARALTFAQISRNRSCQKGECVFEERFTVEIPQAELRSAPSTGYQLKIFARDGGDAAITIGRSDIEQLLAAFANPESKPESQAAAAAN